jgi:hypothetical protein
MATLFDVVTVTCFAALVLAFFNFTDRDPKTLSHMVISAIAFAVANQLGNAGWTALATALILAGSTYAVVVVRR